jgi:hypothetical protein
LGVRLRHRGQTDKSNSQTQSHWTGLHSRESLDDFHFFAVLFLVLLVWINTHSLSPIVFSPSTANWLPSLLAYRAARLRFRRVRQGIKWQTTIA